ncbi:uncharacterized protein Z518_00944 [Rhinocladiella mackenziei CBS 650.93]|uniref:BTB domain-containing protein n=1 Tax=Rhinocladiella mackenziei CBS 650.93 TaxID=1442369 RepID=A0A0D2HGR0_9EURO|nr:uncharacterized protein Z518_00944 [Rhinocladiella mackenziei CBS 650.93]KIX09863.1 hypothetical protein Z518_00944 [Rhinocladiella mackenziei CBS 650.93]
MDQRQKEIYAQLHQSERVDLVVGGRDTPTEAFPFPRDFLSLRSRRFREILKQQEKSVEILDTLPQTMKDFMVWTFSLKPRILEGATFEEVARLGIFACQYQIPALSNQVTDQIRANLASGEWRLQSSIVNDIYKAAASGSPLREVIRAALGQIVRPPGEGEGEGEGGVPEDWEETFKNNPDLGYDCFRVSRAVKDSEWTSDYLSKVCRFHDHQGVSHQSAGCDGCPYAEWECYPAGEQDDVNGPTDEQETVHEAKEANGVHDDLNTNGVTDMPTESAQAENVVDGINGTAEKATMTHRLNWADDSEAVMDEETKPVAAETFVDDADGSVVPESISGDEPQAMGLNGTMLGKVGGSPPEKPQVDLKGQKNQKKRRNRKNSSAV